jgi:hypothetical protein
MRQIGGTINERDNRNIGAMSGNQGRGDRGRSSGRDRQSYRGGLQARGGRGFGRHNSRGRGRGRGRYQTNNDHNLFIPPQLLGQGIRLR